MNNTKTSIRYSNGFTIIELLIVISIIAILSLISFVVFTQIRHRAEVASIEAGASAYLRALSVYKTEYSHLPLESEQVVYAYGDVSVYAFCVGSRYSYVNPERGCGGWTIGGIPTNVNKYKPTDGFHKEILKTIAGQASPTFNCFYVAGNGSCARGYVFVPEASANPSSLDGIKRSFFGYFLPGKEPCRLPGKLAKTTLPVGNVIIKQSVNYVSNLNKNYTFGNDKFTLCLYAV